MFDEDNILNELNECLKEVSVHTVYNSSVVKQKINLTVHTDFISVMNGETDRETLILLL